MKKELSFWVTGENPYLAGTNFIKKLYGADVSHVDIMAALTHVYHSAIRTHLCFTLSHCVEGETERAIKNIREVTKETVENAIQSVEEIKSIMKTQGCDATKAAEIWAKKNDSLVTTVKGRFAKRPNE